MLSWQITDRNQRALATLTDRQQGRVAITRNGGRTAQVAIALDDPAAQHVWPQRALLKCWLDGALIFCGRIASPQFVDQAGAGEGGAGVAIAAADPAAQLARSYLLDYNDLHALALTPPVRTADQSQIMWELVDNVAANDHGVVEGELPATVERDRTYFDGKQVWEALVQMSEVIDGPDFELEPVEADDGTICRLNTFAEQGSLRPAVFEYGFGRHNVAGFTYSPAGEEVCNKFRAVIPWSDAGNIGLSIVAESLSSQEELGGTFEDFEVLTDVLAIETAAEYAAEQVRRRAFPIEYLEITTPPQGEHADPDLADFTGAAYGEPPRFGPDADYWIADTITARIRRNISVDVEGRVEEAEITEDERGAVTVKTTLAPVAVDAADVTTSDPEWVVLDAPAPAVDV